MRAAFFLLGTCCGVFFRDAIVHLIGKAIDFAMKM